MRAALALLPVLWALPGCLPWGDASDWAGAPSGAASWDWILDADSLPQTPPLVDFLGLDGADTPAAFVSAAVAAGTTPWCYLSAGTAEEFRDDYDAFVVLDDAARAAGEPPVLGEPLPDWPGERWLDVRQIDALLPLFLARLDDCAGKGFLLVELDNMDGWTNDTGLGFSMDDERAWVERLVDAAAERGLGAIHKNADDLVPALAPRMDALLLESCGLDAFCEVAAPFVQDGKPVWNVEYPERWREAGRAVRADALCAAARADGVSTLIKPLDLDGRAIVCAAR